MLSASSRIAGEKDILVCISDHVLNLGLGHFLKELLIRSFGKDRCFGFLGLCNLVYFIENVILIFRRNANKVTTVE